MKPLSGLRVLDLTHVLAGPYCTYQLGLLGADITKVEAPIGDMTRIWGGTPAQLAKRIGSGFVPQNAGKRSICLDLNKPEAQACARKLAEAADILVENFEGGTMEKFSLDYATVSAFNPGIIYLSISAFGRNGPYANRPGFDDVVQATSGYMANNIRGDGPIRTGGPVLDYATGMQAASAVLAALLLKARTGKGQYVDLAMQDVAMLLLNRNTSIAASTGLPPAPADNREAPLLGRYQSKDGYVMLAGYFPDHCRAICAAVGLPEYADLTNAAFKSRIEEIESAVEAQLQTKTSAVWDQIFSTEKVVAGGVQSLEETIASGQPAARQLTQEVASAAGPQQVTTAGYRINDGVFGPDGGVPMLGQHSSDILLELGYTSADIEHLIASGAIIQGPDA
tara:strand:- start:10075 stop:11259 length:1185 start_codon:yes stop_codon:yes gene_type:complete